MRAYLVIASSLLDDRKIIHSSFLENLESSNIKLDVISTAFEEPEYRNLYESKGVNLLPFPEIKPFRERYKVLRKINDAAFDKRNKVFARYSLHKFYSKKHGRKKSVVVKVLSSIICYLQMTDVFDLFVDSFFVGKAQVNSDVDFKKYDAVLITGPNRSYEPIIASYLKRIGIKVYAYIHSMDNLSTKNRMYPRFDKVFVWSDEMLTQLKAYYPYTRNIDVAVVGACQYDMLVDKSFELSKEVFFKNIGLNPEKPTILYALGSPNFIKEYLIVSEVLLKLNEIGTDMQVILRPHPQFDTSAFNLQEVNELKNVHLLVQETRKNVEFGQRFQDRNDIVEWVNSLKHADVCLNLSSLNNFGNISFISIDLYSSQLR